LIAKQSGPPPKSTAESLQAVSNQTPLEALTSHQVPDLPMKRPRTESPLETIRKYSKVQATLQRLWLIESRKASFLMRRCFHRLRRRLS
jgi:hypothetical protein